MSEQPGPWAHLLGALAHWLMAWGPVLSGERLSEEPASGRWCRAVERT